MHYLSEGLFHQNKLFQFTFIGPSLPILWLLVFSYLANALVLVFIHFIAYIPILYVTFWMLLLLLPLRTCTTSLQYCYYLRLKKHDHSPTTTFSNVISIIVIHIRALMQFMLNMENILSFRHVISLICQECMISLNSVSSLIE